MRACEKHPRAVVVYEVGIGECPLCAAEDRLRELEKKFSGQGSVEPEKSPASDPR